MTRRQEAARIADAAGIPPDPPTDRWDDPVPLGTVSVLPVFPVGALPGYLAAMVTAVAEEMQVPVDLPAGLALAALSTAAGGRAEIEVRGRWREPLHLYLAVAMPPGSGKSPAFRAMIAPVFAAEAALRGADRERIAEAMVARSVAIAHAEKERREASSAEDLAEAIGACRLAEDLPIPPLTRLTADDVVPEQAATLMAEQGGRLAILSAEGTFLEIVMGRYSNGRPNLELLLKGHAGDRVAIDRRGREEIIDRPALTIGLTVQPDLLRDLSAKRAMHGRGGLARFLISLPKDLVGSRDVTTPVVPDVIRSDYHETVRKLIIDLAAWTDPVVLPMTPGALRAHTAWRAHLEPRLARGTGDLEGLREWASKLPGATARIAGLLHLAEHPSTGPFTPVAEATMDRAVGIARYYTEHAAAAFGVMRAHPALDDARAVLDWITADPARTVFTRRAVHRAFQRRLATAADVDAVLSLLEDHGYIRRAVAGGAAGTTGRRPVLYTVHPSLAAIR